MDPTIERNQLQKELDTVFAQVEKVWTLERQRRINDYRRLILNAREELSELSKKPDLTHQTLLRLIRGWSKQFRDRVESEQQLPKYAQWLDEIALRISDLPDTIVLEQAPERFMAQDGDHFGIRLIKFIKRIGRGFSKAKHKLRNLGLRIVRQEVSPWQSWRQEVPLEYLAMDVILSSEKEWVNEMYHDWYIVAHFLYELEQWQDNWLIGDRNAAITEKQRVYDRISDVNDAIGQVDRLLEQHSETLQNIQSHLAASVEQQVATWKQRLWERIERTGTLEHRQEYTRERMLTHREQREKQLEENEMEWAELNLALLDEIELYHELLQYGYRIDQETDQVLATLEGQAEERWINPVQSALEQVIAVYKEIAAADSPQEWTTQRDMLLQLLDEQWLQKLETNPIANQLKQRLDQYRADVQLGIRSLPEESRVYSDLQLDKELPTYNTKKVPLRDWATRQIKLLLVQKLEVLPEEWEELEKKLFADGNEIREIISVNMASAIEGEETHEVSDPEGQAMLLEGLERALAKLEQLRGNVEFQRLRVQKMIQAHSTEAVWNMLEWISGGEVEAFKRSDRTSQVREVATDWKTSLLALWARAVDRVTVWARWAWRKLSKWGRVLAPWLGLETESETIGEKRKLDITAYLSETDEAIQQLPFVYRKIFSLGATAEQQFYIQQGDLLPRFEKAYKNWLNGYSTNAVLVGERGSGKTTLLQVIKERFIAEENSVTLDLKHTVWESDQLLERVSNALGLPKADNVQELITAIQNREEATRNVVIVEGLQNTYLRHINGFEAINDLLLLISKTRHSIFWITTCSRYAWYFLSKGVSIDDYYSVILETDNLDAKQIQQLILDRHKVSGYDLWFEPTETLKNNRAFKKVMDSPEKTQSYLKGQFFDKLAQISEGNASIAMLFWLRSIKKVEETRLVIAPIEITQLDAIDAMKPETLFSMAAMVLHDSMNGEELALSQHISKHKADMILGRLATLGLIQKVENEGSESWAINTLIYRQTIRALRQRNIIHG